MAQTPRRPSGSSEPDHTFYTDPSKRSSPSPTRNRPMLTAPISTRTLPQARRLRLAEVAHVIADAFCMVPIQGRRDHWRSGHYELRLDRGAKLLQLRVRSYDRHAFRLTLAPSSVGGLRAMV